MTHACFIQAVEIWTPMQNRTHLMLKSGHYGELEYFARISRGMQFSYDEGLPGKCWASGAPVVLEDLTNSFFRRGDAATTVGLTCAVAIPHFVGADLAGVTVLFCGDGAGQAGALEIWHAAKGAQEMTLADSHFGSAGRNLEFASRSTTFSRGRGLPGIVWDSGMPFVIADIERSEAFQRRVKATGFGIDRAVGLPVTTRGPGDWVLTLLSAPHSPIARRVELWTPDDETGCFRFSGGYCESGADLTARYGHAGRPLDVGPMGAARLRGAATLSPGDNGGSDETELVWPVFGDQTFRANVVLSF